MSDGANLGVNSERALATILGGDPEPAEDEHRSPEQLRAYIKEQRGTDSYDATACEAAWRVLLTFEARRETREWPAEPRGEYDVPIDQINSAEDHGAHYRKVGPDLYDAVKQQTDGLGDMSLADLGLTGFQWGWAVNAAKYIVGAPPVPNPAILTVGRQTVEDG